MLIRELNAKILEKIRKKNAEVFWRRLIKQTSHSQFDFEYLSGLEAEGNFFGVKIIVVHNNFVLTLMTSGLIIAFFFNTTLSSWINIHQRTRIFNVWSFLPYYLFTIRLFWILDFLTIILVSNLSSSNNQFYADEGNSIDFFLARNTCKSIHYKKTPLLR